MTGGTVSINRNIGQRHWAVVWLNKDRVLLLNKKVSVGDNSQIKQKFRAHISYFIFCTVSRLPDSPI